MLFDHLDRKKKERVTLNDLKEYLKEQNKQKSVDITALTAEFNTIDSASKGSIDF